MMLRRPSKPILRPFVSLIWAGGGTGHAQQAARELVLPTGAMHLVFRLGGTPLRLFAGAGDAVGSTVGMSIIGGVRAAPYVKALSAPEPMVGVMLRSGAAEPLTGTPAAVLAGAHTPLEDVWLPTDLAELRGRLLSAPSCRERMAITEDFLAARVREELSVSPLIARALARFDAGDAVGAVVADSGYSHRHVVRTFEQAAGLTPKTYCRLRRFGRVLERFQATPENPWADIAAAEGYADQAHLSREFRAFAGVTPGQYRRVSPSAPRHIPISVDRRRAI